MSGRGCAHRSRTHHRERSSQNPFLFELWLPVASVLDKPVSPIAFPHSAAHVAHSAHQAQSAYLKFQKHTRRPHLDCPTTTQEYSRTRRRQIQEVGRPPVECLVDSERQTRTVSQFGRYEHESGINRQQRTPAMDLPMRGNTTRVTTNVGWRSTTNRLRHYLPFLGSTSPRSLPQMAYDLRVSIERHTRLAEVTKRWHCFRCTRARAAGSGRTDSRACVGCIKNGTSTQQPVLHRRHHDSHSTVVRHHTRAATG